MKRIVFLILTGLLVIAPIGSEVSLGFNQTIVTYAAKSTKRKSSSSKKKKSTTKKSTKKKNSSTKKKTTDSNKKYKDDTNKSTTTKKSTSEQNWNSKINNNNSGTNKPAIDDNTTCYISEYGDCYHKSSKCASRKKPIETTVGNAKKYKSKCSKCW